MIIIDLFSERQIENSIDLQCIGVYEFAWRYIFAVEIIKVLNDNNYIILGGDVYRIDDKNRRIFSTEDGWYFNKTNKNDVIESCGKAITYIENYYCKNGDHFCYSFVCELSKV